MGPMHISAQSHWVVVEGQVVNQTFAFFRGADCDNVGHCVLEDCVEDLERHIEEGGTCGSRRHFDFEKE